MWFSSESNETSGLESITVGTNSKDPYYGHFTVEEQSLGLPNWSEYLLVKRATLFYAEQLELYANRYFTDGPH
jgi:hypothetical protein